MPLDRDLLDPLPQHRVGMYGPHEIGAIQPVQLAYLDSDHACDPQLVGHDEGDLAEVSPIVQMAHLLARVRVDAHRARGYEVHAIARLINPHDHVVGQVYLELQQGDDLAEQRQRQIVEERHVLDQFPARVHPYLVAHLGRYRVYNLGLAEESILETELVVLDDTFLGWIRQLLVPHEVFQLGNGRLVPQTATILPLEEVQHARDYEPGDDHAQYTDQYDQIDFTSVVQVDVNQADSHEGAYGTL